MPRGKPPPAPITRIQPGPACRWQTQDMKTTLRIVLALLLLASGALVLALALALQAEPTVSTPAEVGIDDVARAVALMRQHDPRKRPPGTMATALLSERDLDILVQQGVQRWLGAASRVSLRGAGATVQFSDQAPPNPFGRWLNVELRLAETDGLPAIESLRVGSLPVPAWLAGAGVRWLAGRAGLQQELQLAAGVVQRVRFMPQQLQVNYVLRGDTSRRLAAGLASPAELERLRAYSDRLAQLAARERLGAQVSLARLLPPMFELARVRSAVGLDAVAENRAAILVLTLYANRRSLAEALPAARAWTQAQPLRVQLAGREDSTLHFLVSAALAAEAGGRLSQVVGVYKEVADSRGGTGFSFNDLAADRAGTHFGVVAVQDAARLQARAAAIAQELEFMPPAADLPENMPEADFMRRFGGVGAPIYNAMLAEIDRRVAALGVFR